MSGRIARLREGKSISRARHHPHNAVSRIPILKVKDPKSPTLKTSYIWIKCAHISAGADAMIAHSRGPHSAHNIYRRRAIGTHASQRTAKTRGKPVSVPRETCARSRGMARSERLERNFSLADLEYQGHLLNADE